MAKIKFEVTMPDGSKHEAVGNHWLPILLGSDDTVYGETAYYRFRWFADNTMSSPSPGHLCHGGVHVRQFRALKKKIGFLAYVAWPFVWFWDVLVGGGDMEKEAKAEAELHRNHPRLVATYNFLRSIVTRAP